MNIIIKKSKRCLATVIEVKTFPAKEGKEIRKCRDDIIAKLTKEMTESYFDSICKTGNLLTSGLELYKLNKLFHTNVVSKITLVSPNKRYVLIFLKQVTPL